MKVIHLITKLEKLDPGLTLYRQCCHPGGCGDTFEKVTLYFNKVQAWPSSDMHDCIGPYPKDGVKPTTVLLMREG